VLKPMADRRAGRRGFAPLVERPIDGFEKGFASGMRVLVSLLDHRMQRAARDVLHVQEAQLFIRKLAMVVNSHDVRMV
jgi:hypothetical protein